MNQIQIIIENISSEGHEYKATLDYGDNNAPEVITGIKDYFIDNEKNTITIRFYFDEEQNTYDILEFPINLIYCIRRQHILPRKDTK